MPNIVYKPNFTKQMMHLPAGALKLFFYLVDKAENNLINLKKLDKKEFEQTTGFLEKTFYNNMTILISNKFLTRGNAIEFVFLNPDIVEVGSLDQIIRNKLLIEKYPHKLCPQCKPPNANKQLSRTLIHQKALSLWKEVGATNQLAGILLRDFILFITYKGGFFNGESTFYVYDESINNSKKIIAVDEAKYNFDTKKNIEALENQITLLDEEFEFYKNLAKSIILKQNKTHITKEYNIWKNTRSKIKKLKKYLYTTGMGSVSFIENIRESAEDVFNYSFDEEYCNIFLRMYDNIRFYRNAYLNEIDRSEHHLSIEDVKLLRDVVEQIEEWDEYLFVHENQMYC